MDLPAIPANEACYELLRTTAPSLWEEFQRRLLPVADGDSEPEERVREIARLEGELWSEFLAHDTDHRSRELGRSWPCCVEDLTAAVVTAAIPAIAASDEPLERRRERLEALRALVAGPSLTGATVGFDLQRAIHELG